MKNEKSSQIGVWLDNQKALIISLEEGKTSVNEIKSGLDEVYFHEGEAIKGSFSGQQHDNKEKIIEDRRKNSERKFMKHVYDAVEKADQVYIIGPGEMKKNFNHFIIQEHKRLSPKILGLENCDYLKESQIVDKVKKFFNHK